MNIQDLDSYAVFVRIMASPDLAEARRLSWWQRFGLEWREVAVVVAIVIPFVLTAWIWKP